MDQIIGEARAEDKTTSEKEARKQKRRHMGKGESSLDQVYRPHTEHKTDSRCFCKGERMSEKGSVRENRIGNQANRHLSIRPSGTVSIVFFHIFGGGGSGSGSWAKGEYS